jgi:hypothetical protein
MIKEECKRKSLKTQKLLKRNCSIKFPPRGMTRGGVIPHKKLPDFST